MKYKKLNDEVLYIDENIPKLDKAGLKILEQEALKNPRKRIRLCTHRDINDRIHEMFIIHAKGAYIRPHKHLGKSESFFVISGKADAIIFNEDGVVTEIIRMGLSSSKDVFYYRIDTPVFHTVIVHSNILCFKEVTAGPFYKKDVVFASWSPEEKDTDNVNLFIKRLQEVIKNN